jgi:translation initiation factor eIF-2B subunit gamma
MDFVTIGDGAKLEGCIVGRGAKIGERCDLRDSEVGGGMEVEGEMKVKNEKLSTTL